MVACSCFMMTYSSEERIDLFVKNHSVINPPSVETFLYPFPGGKGSFLTPGDFYRNKYKSIVQYSTQKILKNHKICTLYGKHKRDITLMSYMSL